jgi:putative ABC transport system permease protein
MLTPLADLAVPARLGMVHWSPPTATSSWVAGRAWGVSWYRFRATFRRRRGSYLALILLVGLVGGLAFGAIAAARRTQSSFSTYLASTNPSQLSVSVFGALPTTRSGSFEGGTLAKEMARLPHVTGVRYGEVINGIPLSPDGALRIKTLGKVYPIASPDGEYFTQDRVTVIAGRMANPDRPGQVMMTRSAARLLGYHVGQTFPYGLYTNEQHNLKGFGTARVPPAIRLQAKLVGIVDFSSEIVEDDIDRYPTFAFLTPALAREVLANPKESFSGGSTFSLQVDDGSLGVNSVEGGISRLIPSQNSFSLHATAPVVAKSDRAVKPLSISLGVFGAVAFVATLLIAAQAIARRLRESDEEHVVLRSLGANPTVVIADGLIGIVGATVIGALLAVVVALLLSPIGPLGPVRPVYPHKGFAADWTVLGFGSLALLVALAVVAAVMAYRGAPHRAVNTRRLARPASSGAVRSAIVLGLPAPGLAGVRMAFEPGTGRTSVPVRSALAGTSMAVMLLVAMVTFGSSLHTLVKRPALYGWNWTYMLNQVGAGSAGVPPQALTQLARDADVAAATGVDYNDLNIDGQNTPFLFGDLHASITPPITSGRALERKGQIVLGASTMAQLHKHLGDHVTVTYGSVKDDPIYVPPTRLTIVGTATMPAVGFATVISDHTSMGIGALVPFSVLPPAFQKAISSPYSTLNGPNLVFVRLKPGIAAQSGRANLQRIAESLNRDFSRVPNGEGQGNIVVVQGVQRPAEIVDYRTIGIVPTLLVSGLALGAVAALALTLAASVRRRRRDLALLKTLGFTQRQLAATVAWQASISAIVGVVVGVPIGIVLGRSLWDLFARQIYAVPEPTIPAWSIVLIVAGTLLLANIVAAVPARIAARTSTAFLLRGE